MELLRFFLCLFISVSFFRQHMNHAGTVMLFRLDQCFLQAFQVVSVDRTEILETERFKESQILIPHHHGFQDPLCVMNRRINDLTDHRDPVDFPHMFLCALVSGADSQVCQV